MLLLLEWDSCSCPHPLPGSQRSPQHFHPPRKETPAPNPLPQGQGCKGRRPSSPPPSHGAGVRQAHPVCSPTSSLTPKRLAHCHALPCLRKPPISPFCLVLGPRKLEVSGRTQLQTQMAPLLPTSTRISSTRGFHTDSSCSRELDPGPRVKPKDPQQTAQRHRFETGYKDAHSTGFRAQGTNSPPPPRAVWVSQTLPRDPAPPQEK